MINNEVWKDVEGYEGRYQVSNTGKLKSIQCKGKPKHRILKGNINKGGYKYFVLLNHKGETKTLYIHRLVAQHFIPNLQNKKTVNHKNEIKTDNNVDNLEWFTTAEQNKYGRRTEKTEIPIVAYHPITKHTINYKSMREGERAGFTGPNISLSIKNGRTHKGYRFYKLEDWEGVKHDN